MLVTIWLNSDYLGGAIGFRIAHGQ
jgi:hypothetical protein